MYIVKIVDFGGNHKTDCGILISMHREKYDYKWWYVERV